MLEALALCCSLMNPEKHAEVLDLAPYGDVLERHRDFIDTFKGHESLHFCWLEFALAVSERKDLDVFFSALEEMVEQDPPAFLRTFLGQALDQDEARKALASPEALSGQLTSLGLAASLGSELHDLKRFLARLYGLIEDIWGQPAFIAAIRENAASYQAKIEGYEAGLKDRHPLSYAQELMGKPFWNIADYTRYEFVPIHFMNPYRLRLMDDKTMIYVDCLKRLPKAGERFEARLTEALKALGDPTRVRILRLVYNKPMFGKEIAEALGLTTATISHHLEALRSLGLLNMEQVKQLKYFSTNLYALRGVSQDLEAYIKQSS